jgi:hypothetical protein
MKGKTAMPSLKAAARAYVRAVFTHLAERCAEYDAHTDWQPEWVPEGDGGFRLRPSQLPAYEACLLFESLRTPEPPESERLNEAMRRDSRLGPFIGALVGTADGNAWRLDQDALRRSLLFAVARAAEGLSYGETHFGTAYDEWLTEAAAREQEFKLLAPIANLRFEGAIELGDGWEIGQLTDEEIATCLGTGTMPNLLGPSGFAMIVGRAGIRFAWREQRGDYEQFSEREREEALAASAAHRERVRLIVEALRLFKRGRVSIGGIVVTVGTGRRFTASTHAGLLGEALEMTDHEGVEFESFFPIFERVRKEHQAVDAAIRRFSYAAERTRRDDEIVDLVAALEALLLSDTSERSELKFRTALRGALLVTSSDLTRRQVFEQLGRAYKARSAVAHGDTPGARILILPDGTRVTLAVFVAHLEELVRLALRRAVEALGSGARWPPDWTGLALGEATWPSP